MLVRLKAHAKALKTEIHALMVACHDPRTPWPVRMLALLVVAYALSPMDLIPDFIPVLGYVDDLILLPLGIALLVRLIPPEVLRDARQTATQFQGRALSRMGAVLVGLVWLIGLATVVAIAIRLFK
jgi:uncharacterized membrane protein YkvA (DUF1232 family)